MRTTFIFTLVILSTRLAWVGSYSLAASAPPDNATVRINNMQFEPATVRVKVGGSVTWSNADDRDHTVNAVDNSFQSGNIKPNASWTFRFNSAGSFDYACSYHPRMRGTVIVENK